jgi:hypothetical protein
VIAGKRDPKTGTVTKPMLVNARTKKSVKSYDYFLKKSGKYYLGWGKFWPTFSPHYAKPNYRWTYRSNPFFFNFNPKQYMVKVGPKYYPIHGKFLYWWDKGNLSMYRKHNINWIWSIRECVWHMAKSGNYNYYWWIRNYRSWFDSYWTGLAWNSRSVKMPRAKPKPKSSARTWRRTTAKSKPKSSAKTWRRTTAKSKPKSSAKTWRRTTAKTKPKTSAKTWRRPTAKTKPRPTAKTRPKRKTMARSKPVLRIVSRRPAARRRVSTPTYRRKAA